MREMDRDGSEKFGKRVCRIVAAGSSSSCCSLRVHAVIIKRTLGRYFQENKLFSVASFVASVTDPDLWPLSIRNLVYSSFSDPRITILWDR